MNNQDYEYQKNAFLYEMENRGYGYNIDIDTHNFTDLQKKAYAAAKKEYLMNNQYLSGDNLVKGKVYKWKYTPVMRFSAKSKCICEAIGKFTGEYDDLSGLARMILLDDIGGYILADPQSLEEVY